MTKGEKLFTSLIERYKKAYHTYNNKRVTSLIYIKGFVVILTDNGISEMQVRPRQFAKMTATLEERALNYLWKKETEEEVNRLKGKIKDTL